MKKTFGSARSRRAVKTSFVALVTGLSLIPATAASAAIATPPAAPHDITVFSVRDMVEVGGYDTGEQIEIKVLRNGVTIGRTTGTAAGPDGEAGFEVNHDNLKCWIGNTPDISPGDVVQATTSEGNGDAVTVADVFTEAAVADGDDIVAHGTAKNSTGGRLSLDLLEARIIAPELTGTAIGRRDLRAPNERGGYSGVLTYDSPTSTNFTARYSNLPAGVQEIALGGETRVLGWQAIGTVIENGVEAEGPVGLNIYEHGAPEGGAPGCPARADYGVITSSPSVINLATNGTGAGLVLSGIANDASAVSVTLDDSNSATPAADATGVLSDPSGAQSWTATVPWSEVDALDNGTLTATGSWTVGTGTVGGKTLSVTKDLNAPTAPAATPPAGTYSTSQSVSLRNAAETSVSIYYTNDGTVPTTDPADKYTGPINVTASQTIRAISVDGVGNKSPELSAAYVIGAPTDSTAPRIVARIPSIGSTNIAVGTNVTVRFNEALKASTVTGSNFSLRAQGATTDVPAAVSYVGGPNNEAVLNPTSDLAANTVYNATVTNGLQDVAGNPLGAPPQLTWSFTTRAGTTPGDTTAPTLVGRGPGIGATGAARSSNIFAMFSENVNSATITNATFSVKRTSTGAAVAGVFSYTAPVPASGATPAKPARSTFDPTGVLLANTQYTVTLTSGIKDAANNGLVAPPALTWTFTTGA